MRRNQPRIGRISMSKKDVKVEDKKKPSKKVTKEEMAQIKGGKAARSACGT
jgi:bacteriocin-like protein